MSKEYKNSEGLSVEIVKAPASLDVQMVKGQVIATWEDGKPKWNRLPFSQSEVAKVERANVTASTLGIESLLDIADVIGEAGTLLHNIESSFNPTVMEGLSKRHGIVKFDGEKGVDEKASKAYDKAFKDMYDTLSSNLDMSHDAKVDLAKDVATAAKERVLSNAAVKRMTGEHTVNQMKVLKGIAVLKTLTSKERANIRYERKMAQIEKRKLPDSVRMREANVENMEDAIKGAEKLVAQG